MTAWFRGVGIWTLRGLLWAPEEFVATTVSDHNLLSTVEGNETFSLSVYNPVGGDFGEGVEELTATRTIIDDDGMMV
jgi:hypothetical protein